MVAITAALAPQPTFAAAVNELVITENSDTSLTATYNGSPVTVTFDGTDQWHFTLPNTVTFNTVDGGQGVNWLEPENSSQANTVIFPFINSNEVGILKSDQPINTKFPLVVSNGTTVPDIGSDSSNNENIDATFNDLGDVPEPATWAVPSLITCLIAVHFLRGVCSKKTAKSQTLFDGWR